ncbi:MAG TPA: class I SAM-dependent methyltransferase [Phycisphaerae bacterium]|nr:class I SAM-dependent methyltransferase [Phycisphaerae bacterium]
MSTASGLAPPARRNDLPHYLTHLGLHGVGVEVGVREGTYAGVVLAGWSGTMLLVDPWRQLDDYNDPANVADDQQEKRFERALKVARKHSPRAHLLRMFSHEAARLLRPESLDFVYLDAQHTLPGFRQDLHLWYPLLKHGGLFAGHDYFDGSFDMGARQPSDDPNGEFPCQVKSTVDAFAAAVHRQIRSTTEDKFPSWFIIK